MTTTTMTPPSTGSVGSRVGAYLIDSLLAMVVSVVVYVLPLVGVLVGSAELAVVGLGAAFLLALAYFAGYVVKEGRSGTTPGKRAVGLRTVDETTGGPIGVGRAFVRLLVLGLLGPLNLIQLFTIPQHPRGQGWHDALTRSVVVPVSATVVRGPVAAGTGGAPQSSLPGPRPAEPWPQSSVPNLASAPPAAPVPPSVVAPPPGAVTPPPEPVERPEPTAEVAPPPSATLAAPPRREVTIAEAPSTSTWTLVAANGRRRELSGLLLVGRDPDPGLVQGAAVWALDDPELSVSKTHALFGSGDEGPWVEDWHSTNGTRLRRDGSVEELGPRTRTVLREGDGVDLGTLSVVVGVESR